jgi:hypothetical protein
MEKHKVATILIAIAGTSLLIYIVIWNILFFDRNMVDRIFILCCYTSFSLASILLCKEASKMDHIIGIMLAVYGLVHVYAVIGFIINDLTDILINFDFLMTIFRDVSPGLVLACGITILAIWKERGTKIARVMAGTSLIALSLVNVCLSFIYWALDIHAYAFMYI